MDEKNIAGVISIAKDKLLMSSVYKSKLNCSNCASKIKKWN